MDVLSERIHPAALETEELLKQCIIDFGRRSGPGGQNRNKVESAVNITHRPTGVIGSASERRSQGENRRVAIFRLRLNLALTQRGWFDLRHIPSDLWRSRCSREGRLAINPRHRDYPALLAEAMDVLFALKLDPARSAMLLGCTTSQLVKLLKDEPRALSLINQARQERNMHLLR